MGVGKEDAEKRDEDRITGNSIGDSIIQNMNKLIKNNLEELSAKAIWEVSKTLGTVFRGDESKVMKQIKAMEDRDRLEQEQTVAEKEGSQKDD
ncbi:hypothetical protein Ancab_021706, partial [Ancistrocladus abbreviatus]